jgi:predicted metal-dependent phosphoesterase TrpH
MTKIDHHLHTSRHSPDSVINPSELIERACAVGLDAVVITEHDYQWQARELADLATEAARHGLKVFSGAEISAREGHFLVYGLPDLQEAPPGITLAELLGVVGRCGAAIVAAHPFRWEQDFQAIVQAHGAAFDALELVSNNVTPDTRQKTEQLLRRYPMGATGSSDGHEPDVVGCYYSEFPGRIETVGDFVAALKRKESRPGHHHGARQSSGPVM